MKTLLVLLFFSCTVSSAYAQAPWTGPAGGGMISVQEAHTLWPTHIAVGMACDNYDRDPLGIDVYECRLDWRMGLAKRFDLYGSYQISRALSVPGAVPVPSPPLDILVMSGPIPQPPYRAMYWPMPYLAPHPSRLDEMTPGEYTFGIKALLMYQHGWQPALATNLQVTIPGTMSPYSLEKGSGSGSVDVALHTSATWSVGRLSVSANTGLTRTGNLRQSDRFILDNGHGTREAQIRRPNLLHLGIGTRVHLWRGLSAIVETSGWLPVGAHTPMLDESGAHDILGGIQFTWKHLAFIAAYHQHLNPPPNGMVRATGPLAGAIDLSHVSPTEQSQWLASIGVDPISRRTGTSLVVVGAPTDTTLPTGAYRVAPTYIWHTTGNGGTLVSLSFIF